jgi:hypothetical protein
MADQAVEQFHMSEGLWRAIDESYKEVARVGGFDICRECWRFYYDETGNYRHIVYRNGVVPDARSITQDFMSEDLSLMSDKAWKEPLTLLETSLHTNWGSKVEDSTGEAETRLRLWE